ncbi:helix-turn-helix transcriptional regulator [Sedimentibacter sp. MB35-C1]|uniref:helix-turn-helix domain-containing protein n=1 Tax=Sedimentibacter sp. MB35-C1 TaxID=3070995 RepID=UPI0027E1D1C1|nr:helix-turn-helix transcriptional regulator [Sedimentibacter sp. MB35-C1]WMJ77835.1 helix-turn-helix transcriptional regulator [Sedimentibacter sp. MB35-C1]
MFDANIFAERLQLLRKKANVSQKILSDHIGVSYHTISKIENKQRAASIEVITAIAEYFDVSLDYLTGRTDLPDITDKNKGLDITPEESELLEEFRLLNKYEQNIIVGKISEILYNKNIENRNMEMSEEIAEVDFKDRVNK